MEASELMSIRELEEENSRLKPMYPNLERELDTAKYIIEKNFKALREAKDLEELRPDRPKDISKTCRIIRVSRSSLFYQSVTNDRTLMAILEDLAYKNPSEGFWKCYGRIRNEGLL